MNICIILGFVRRPKPWLKLAKDSVSILPVKHFMGTSVSLGLLIPHPGQLTFNVSIHFDKLALPFMCLCQQGRNFSPSFSYYPFRQLRPIRMKLCLQLTYHRLMVLELGLHSKLMYLVPFIQDILLRVGEIRTHVRIISLINLVRVVPSCWVSISHLLFIVNVIKLIVQRLQLR